MIENDDALNRPAGTLSRWNGWNGSGVGVLLIVEVRIKSVWEVWLASFGWMDGSGRGIRVFFFHVQKRGERVWEVWKTNLDEYFVILFKSKVNVGAQ